MQSLPTFSQNARFKPSVCSGICNGLAFIHVPLLHAGCLRPISRVKSGRNRAQAKGTRELPLHTPASRGPAHSRSPPSLCLLPRLLATVRVPLLGPATMTECPKTRDRSPSRPPPPPAIFYGPVGAGNPVVESFEKDLHECLSFLRRHGKAEDAGSKSQELYRRG